MQASHICTHIFNLFSTLRPFTLLSSTQADSDHDGAITGEELKQVLENELLQGLSLSIVSVELFVI